MRIIKNLTGMRFGRLVVVSVDFIRSNKHIYWHCLCDCGNKKLIRGSHLISGNIVSCGCFKIECIQKANTRHGMVYTSEYSSWHNMIQRCNNPKCISYPNYGERGITVCQRWLNSIHNFVEDMGSKPGPEYSIERRENDKGYYKENCYWATKTEQQNNTRRNVFYPYRESQFTISQLTKLPEAIENRLSESTLYSRIVDSNWSIEKAINTPVKACSISIHTHNGITKTISEWAREYGIDYNKLYCRLIKLKWNFEKAVNIP